MAEGVEDIVLDLVETDDLIDELVKRFDLAAFVGVRRLARDDAREEVTYERIYRFYGDPYALVGLLGKMWREQIDRLPGFEDEEPADG